MFDQESSLKRLKSRLDRLPEHPSGLLALGRALVGQIDPSEEGACATHQDTLPDYIEAELNGQPVRRLFPDLAYHLDICPACGQVYIDLLEIALEAEGAPLPTTIPATKLDLSFLPALTLTEQVRQVVETLAEGLLHRTNPEFLPDLLAASRAFFRRVDELGARFQLRVNLGPALGFGGDLPPNFQMVVIAYLATEQILDTLSIEELAAELSGARPPRTLQKHARSAARDAGLRGRKVNQVAAQYVVSAQAQADDLLDLARRIATGEKLD